MSRRKWLASRRHVLLALAHRRQLDVDHAQAEVQVLAEVALVDLLAQVAVGRRQHPHVDLDRLVAADPLDLALLEDAQQLGLQRDVELADLVEEDRAAVGLLEAAEVLADRAGEAALLVAEQRRLDQLLGDRAAVEHDERLGLARRRVVHRARDHLLAGAGLAGDQHGQLAGRHLLELREDLPHRRRAADDRVEAIALRQLDLDDVLHRLELDRGVAEAEHRARPQEHLADAQVADVDAVARVQVAQPVAVVARGDLEVGPRHRLVGQHQVADDAAAAGHPRLDDLELLALIGAADHDQLALAQALHRRPRALEHRGEPRAFEAGGVVRTWLHRREPNTAPPRRRRPRPAGACG
jgi:hypothetical protein